MSLLSKTGVLLINLGTPDAPTTPALRRYLAEFLWDQRVVELPRPLWWLIPHGIILPTRPAKSAAYKKYKSPFFRKLAQYCPTLLHPNVDYSVKTARILAPIIE